MNFLVALFEPSYILYLAVIFAGFLAGLFILKKNTDIRPITLLLGVTFFSETIVRFVGRAYKNGMPVYHVFNIIQFVLLALFFYRVIRDPRMKKYIRWLIWAMIAFTIFNTLFLQGIKTFPDNFLKAQVFFMLILGASLFIQELDSPAKENIFLNPKFIVAVGILWFNFFSLLFMIFNNFFLKYHISSTSIGNMHYFSNIIYYPILLYATILSYSYYRHERKDQ